MYEWDEKKRRENLKKHGVDFDAAGDFEWDHAVIFEDVRDRYGEARWVAFGPIDGKLHALVFTERDGEATRVISLREATTKEKRLYAKETSTQKN